MAGHVYYFADEEQAGNFAALHRFGGEFVGVDAAGGYFGFFVAFCSCWCDRPGVGLFLEIGEGSVCPGSWSVRFQPAVREAMGQKLSQFGSECVQISRRLWIAKCGSNLAAPGARSIRIGCDGFQ